jgi:signal transduction histidine kinase
MMHAREHTILLVSDDAELCAAARRIVEDAAPTVIPASDAQQVAGAKNVLNGEAFGELLRHEMNNPLTGILGNAEPLLAEVRRKNDSRLAQGGQQRLETIAALAVRRRETVRRLSQECETRQQPAQ